MVSLSAVVDCLVRNAHVISAFKDVNLSALRPRPIDRASIVSVWKHPNSRPQPLAVVKHSPALDAAVLLVEAAEPAGVDLSAGVLTAIEGPAATAYICR
jgi:hypothetical protein